MISNIKLLFINIPATNLIAVGIFSKKTKASIVRLFLLNMIISFVNYTGDKNDFFNNTQMNENCDINKINSINFNYFLHSKIYDSFLSIPIQIHFIKNVEKIFKKKTLYIKEIYYKNYYLIDLSNNKIILNYNSLYNTNNNMELKIFKFRKIWKELLSHCHDLKEEYMKKNKMEFNIQEYQNFFLKIEYKTTYPRRAFIIQFLPLYNGMCIIHEYIQLKVATFEGEEKNRKIYKEREICGYDTGNYIIDNNLFKSEHYILKQMQDYFVEALFCSNSSIKFFFVLEKREKIYFSEEILKIIREEIDEYMERNKNLNKYLKSNENNYYSKALIQIITKRLYEEFIQINNAEKIVHKSSSALQLRVTNSNLSFKDIINDKNGKSSLKITKYEALTYLFDFIEFNKNINPNDITIDLNDDRKSEKYDNIRASELIDRNSKPSVRFSDLLSEKLSMRPSGEIPKKNEKPMLSLLNCPFPKDSDNLEYNNTDEAFINKNIRNYEEMSIGTKIKKKYYQFGNDNYKNYSIIKNNDDRKKSKNNNDILQKKNSIETSFQKCLIDEKISLENLNYNNIKSNKILNDKYFH
jgi:hypothetical protein